MAILLCQGQKWSYKHRLRFDFIDSSTFEETFRGVTRMFYLRPPHITNIERDMTLSMDTAKHAGVRQVVFLSMKGIEQAKYVPQLQGETYLIEINMQTTFRRCSFFMQNLNTTHCREIKESNEIFVPVGKAKTAFIDARDIGVVAAVTKLEDGHADRNYALTGSKPLNYWEVASIMSEILGRRIIYRNPSLLHFLIEAMRRGTLFMFALVMTVLYTSTRFGMAEPITDQIEQLTGKEPINFRQYVMDYEDVWM